MGHQATEVLTHLNPLESLTVSGELLFGGPGGGSNCGILSLVVLPLSTEHSFSVVPFKNLWVCLHATKFALWGMHRVLDSKTVWENLVLFTSLCCRQISWAIIEDERQLFTQGLDQTTSPMDTRTLTSRA